MLRRIGRRVGTGVIQVQRCLDNQGRKEILWRCASSSSLSASTSSGGVRRCQGFLLPWRREVSSSPQSQDSEDKRATMTSEEAEGGEDMQGEYTLELTPEELEELTNGDPELGKKVKYIQLEHEVYKQEGMMVPSKVKMSQWKELLALATPNSRRRYYEFLFKNEMKAINDKRKKEAKREQRWKELQETGQMWGPKGEEEDQYGMTYGLGRNTLSMRLYDTTVNRFHHNKVIHAMQFGRPLVIDCGYDEFMSPRETKNCAKQIELMLAQNRNHNEPFNPWLCNMKKDSLLFEYLKRINPAITEDSHPINITEKSYLDIFTRKELVYLTPHARDELDEYDEDEVYIIGGMVDKSDPRPFSLAKAKKENLKMKKLPLDKYLVWGLGNKSLTLNQMMGIMLDIRFTGDWKLALDHVPKRKLNRDFHPYPDQIENNEGLEGIRSPSAYASPRDAPFQRSRHQHKSQVLEDYDFMTSRKGFNRGFTHREDSKTEKFKYQVRENPGKFDNRSRVNARSLLDD